MSPLQAASLLQPPFHLTQLEEVSPAGNGLDGGGKVLEPAPPIADRGDADLGQIRNLADIDQGRAVGREGMGVGV